MGSNKKDNLNEELSKTDVEKQVKVYMDSSEFKAKIEKIVRDRMKNEKELEDKIVDVTKNVLTQLYKNLWTKRSIWRNNLKNKAN